MRTISLLSALLVAPLLASGPCTAQDTADAPRGTEGVYTRTIDQKDNELFWIDTEKGIEVRSRGEVVLTGDTRGVARLSPDGYLILQEERGGAVRRMEYRPGAGGEVVRRYLEGGERKAPGAAAEAWASGLLEQVARSSTIGARARARQILAREGVAGVLAEIPRLERGSVKNVYVAEVLGSGELRPEDNRRLLKLVEEMSPSSAQREILRTMLAGQKGRDGHWADWLRTVGTLSSSPDRRELLKDAVEAIPQETALPAPFFEVLDGMSSSSDRRTVLFAVVAKRPGDAPSLERVMRSTSRLTSSSDKREVLKRVATTAREVDPLVPAYLEVVRGMDSSSNQREALSPLLARRGLSEASYVAWLRAVGRLDSDPDKGRLLMASIGRLPDTRTVRTAFQEAAETIRTNSTYNQVVTAYLRGRG